MGVVIISDKLKKAKRVGKTISCKRGKGKNWSMTEIQWYKYYYWVMNSWKRFP